MKHLIYLSCLFFLFSCDNNNNKDNNSTITNPEEAEFSLTNPAAELYQIVGEKHDTAMLLMTNIGKMQSLLRIQLEATETLEAEKDSILNLLTALKKADDGMMNWMREFKSTELNDEEYKAMSEEQIMNYLKDEEAKIEKIHLEMINSIKSVKLKKE